MITEPISEAVLRSVFLRKIRKAPMLALDLNGYSRLPSGSPERSFSWLWKIANQCVEERDKIRQRSEYVASLRGSLQRHSALAALDAASHRSGGNICFAFQTGSCTRCEKCRCEHVTDPSWRVAAASVLEEEDHDQFGDEFGYGSDDVNHDEAVAAAPAQVGSGKHSQI